MSNKTYSGPHSAKRYLRNKNKAQQLLESFHQGDHITIELFQRFIKRATTPDYIPTKQEARAVASFQSLQAPRLNLEKLKNNAKDLLKALKSEQPDALIRLKNHHPHASELLTENYRLNHAQLILARELGLPSWPSLKKHISDITNANITDKKESDRNLLTLHIRCGSDLKDALPASDFSGDFLEIINPFPQGPVPPSEPLDYFVKTREAFVQNYFSYFAADINGKNKSLFEIEERALRQLPGKYQRIVLWFEHDAFDQLCFAYILHHLEELDIDDTIIEIIQINSFPGVERFIGLGQLSQYPAAIRLLWQQRRKIDAQIIHFGSRVWHAYTHNNPHNLWQIQKEKHSPLPIMQKAIERMLQELPWTNNGLSLTEQLILAIIQQDGPISRQRLFLFFKSEADPQVYFGDIMFYWALDNLIDTPNPAIKRLETKDNPTTYSLTDIGKQLLEDKLQWMILSPNERWIGGVKISAKEKKWFWNANTKQPELIELKSN